MKSSARSLFTKCLLFAGSLFLLANLTKASTIYTMDDGSVIIATVNSSNHWFIQLINLDSTGSESGIITQRAASDQVSQMIAEWGSPVSTWNNDNGYSDILQIGFGPKPSGSYLVTSDTYYIDGIGRFDEYVLPSSPPAPYLIWIKGAHEVWFDFNYW